MTLDNDNGGTGTADADTGEDTTLDTQDTGAGDADEGAQDGADSQDDSGKDGDGAGEGDNDAQDADDQSSVLQTMREKMAAMEAEIARLRQPQQQQQAQNNGEKKSRWDTDPLLTAWSKKDPHARTLAKAMFEAQLEEYGLSPKDLPGVLQETRQMRDEFSDMHFNAEMVQLEKDFGADRLKTLEPLVVAMLKPRAQGGEGVTVSNLRTAYEAAEARQIRKEKQDAARKTQAARNDKQQRGQRAADGPQRSGKGESPIPPEVEKKGSDAMLAFMLRNRRS